MTYAPAINMVPKPLHYQNLREELGRYGWDKLRKPVIEKAAGKCGVCSGEGETLFGHEEWEYDTAASPAVARLTDIRPICQSCHRVEHFAHTGLMVIEGHYAPDAIEQAIAHFCRLNRVGIKEFEAHQAEAFARWEQLTELEWRIDWGPYAGLVEAAQAKRAAKA